MGYFFFYFFSTFLENEASYVKSVRPDVRVIGVEAEDAAGMTESLREGQVTALDSVGLFADGELFFKSLF